MNGNALIRILATFALLIASLWVSFDIFTSGSNTVARFYMYTLVGAGIFGLLNARRGFFILIFLTGYLDFFKRLMIFDSGWSKLDLYYVLGIAPALLAGITGNILYQHFTGKLPGRPGLNKLIVVTVCACGASLALALSSNSGGYRSLGDSVNASIYILLLFITPVLFRTPEDLRHLLKVLVVLYVPAILYMIVHQFHGIFKWEEVYLKSGLTIEIRQLNEKIFRPFGTLNSAANASVVFAGIWALCLSGLWRSPSRFGGRSEPFQLRFFLIPLLTMAMAATYSRMGWIIAVVAVLTVPFLKSRITTLAGYCLVIATMVTVIISSPYLLKHKLLNSVSQEIWEQGRTAEWGQATNIATLNDRLEGFAALMTEPRVWTPFGLKLSPYSVSAVMNSVENTHDAFTRLLMDYGFVTLLLGAGYILRQLWKLHRIAFRDPEPLVRSLVATCLALCLSITSGATVNGAQFSTYPVNFFIWFFASVAISLYLYTLERAQAAAAAAGVEAGSREAPPWARDPSKIAPPRQGPVPAPVHAKV